MGPEGGPLFRIVPGGAFVRRPGAPRHMTTLDLFDALIARARELARTL